MMIYLLAKVCKIILLINTFSNMNKYEQKMS